MLLLLNAATADLGLSLVVIHRIKMRPPDEPSPAYSFPQVVNARLGIDLDFVPGLGAGPASRGPGGNDKRVICARLDRGALAAALNDRMNSGTEEAVGPIDIDHGAARRRPGSFEGRALRGASPEGNGE